MPLKTNWQNNLNKYTLKQHDTDKMHLNNHFILAFNCT